MCEAHTEDPVHTRPNSHYVVCFVPFLYLGVRPQFAPPGSRRTAAQPHAARHRVSSLDRSSRLSWPPGEIGVHRSRHPSDPRRTGAHSDATTGSAPLPLLRHGRLGGAEHFTYRRRISFPCLGFLTQVATPRRREAVELSLTVVL